MKETQFQRAGFALRTATLLMLLGCAASPSEEPAAAAPGQPVAEAPEANETVVEFAGAAAQIAAAVTAAPPDLRAAATVRGYAADGELVLLRAGSNHLVCLADEPSDERFQVSCYHASLEPYMARLGPYIKMFGYD